MERSLYYARFYLHSFSLTIIVLSETGHQRAVIAFHAFYFHGFQDLFFFSGVSSSTPFDFKVSMDWPAGGLNAMSPIYMTGKIDFGPVENA